VALGEATKTIPYITDATKAYEFTVNLGAATNTDDAEGEVIKTSDLRPDDTQIVEALQGFVGDIMQVPPQYSAVKIDGQRAYKLARAGEEMEIAARPLWVEELLLSDRPSADQAVLEMTCGKGGYVRSIARDVGEVLGCYGHVAQLRRLWSGSFDLEHAISLEQIEPLAKTAEIDQFLRPLEEGLTDLLQGTTNAEGAAKLHNGNPAICFTTAQYGDEIWVSYEGKAQAIGRYKSGEIHPTRVILQD
jgi:tRNA pseudouridine55 synthase